MSLRRPAPRFSRFQHSPSKLPTPSYRCTALALAFLAGAAVALVLRGQWVHATILLARAERRPSVAAAARPEQPPQRVVVLSSAYSGGGGSSARKDERVRVVARNAALRSVDAVHLLRAQKDVEVEDAVQRAVDGIAGAAPLVFERLPDGSDVTYAALFAYANKHLSGKIVVLANADIYFDESLACAGLLQSGRGAVLALSRHPSPDCVAGSGHGDTAWEPQDLCAAYHPQAQASHDVFAFVAPLADEFVAALGNLRVNQFGAENVVLWNMRRFARVEPLNPCGNVHAFHAHCDAGARAESAHQSKGNEGDRRREFGATTRHGFLDPSLWGGRHSAGVDCLLLGYSLSPRDVNGVAVRSDISADKSTDLPAFGSNHTVS